MIPAKLPDQAPSVVLATAELPCPRWSRQKKMRRMVQARQSIAKLYNDELPLFTKAASQDIVQQFDQCAAGVPLAAHGQIIHVPALN